MKKLKYILIGIICLLVLILIVNLYLYWKSTVNDNHGYNSINALIALLALLVNIITIFFLYINYQQQQKHIKTQEEELNNNKQDTEFNRLLDIIYKQLEYTNDALEELDGDVFTNLTNSLNLEVDEKLKDDISAIYFASNDELISYMHHVNDRLQVYNTLFKSSGLDDKLLDKLKVILITNFGWETLHYIIKINNTLDKSSDKFVESKLPISNEKFVEFISIAKEISEDYKHIVLY